MLGTKFQTRAYRHFWQQNKEPQQLLCAPPNRAGGGRGEYTSAGMVPHFLRPKSDLGRISYSEGEQAARGIARGGVPAPATEHRSAPLRVGEPLFSPAGRLQFAYFPTSSIVTLSYPIDEGGAMAKAWPVGREGMLGISLFLDGPKRDNRADVQVGGLAFRLAAADLLVEFRWAHAFQNLLFALCVCLDDQASQLGLCNHYHPIEQRLCRFLSRLFDRVAGDEVAITHERMGELLGVRRESITEAALQLHAAGIIEYRRGHVKLTSRKKLEARACACGAVIRRAFEVVFE